MNNHYLYCAVDKARTNIKIGVSTQPYFRVSDLIPRGMDMKLVCLLELSPKHYEDAGILDEDANYISSTHIRSNNYEYFGFNPVRKIRRLEKFFKTKFKDDTIFGSTEWFTFTDERINYIKRMFSKLSATETTALVRARLTITE